MAPNPPARSPFENFLIASRPVAVYAPWVTGALLALLQARKLLQPVRDPFPLMWISEAHARAVLTELGEEARVAYIKHVLSLTGGMGCAVMQAVFAGSLCIRFGRWYHVWLCFVCLILDSTANIATLILTVSLPQWHKAAARVCLPLGPACWAAKIALLSFIGATIYAARLTRVRKSA